MKTYSRERERERKEEEQKQRTTYEMEKEKRSVRDRILCLWDVILGFVLFFRLMDSSIKQRSYGKLIMSSAYLPFSPPQRNKHTDDYKMGNVQQQRVDSSGSMATSALSLFSLPHTVLEAW